MTKGNIIGIVFLAVIIAIAITVKIKYGGREIVVNESSETVFQDIKDIEKKLRPGTNEEGWKEMESLCKKLLEKYPDSKEAPYTRLKLAGIYSKGYRDYDRTIEELRSVLKQYPKLPDREGIYWQLLDAVSKTSKENGDKTKKLDIYKEYLAEFPNSRKAEQLTFEMGEMYRARGDIESAENEYNKVISIYREGKYTDNSLYALALIELNRNNKEKALELLKSLISEYPNSDMLENARKKLEGLGESYIETTAKIAEDDGGIYLSHFFEWWLKMQNCLYPKYELTVGEIKNDGDQWSVTIKIEKTGPFKIPLEILFRAGEEEHKEKTKISPTVERDEEASQHNEEYTFSIPFEPEEIILDPEDKILKDNKSLTRWRAEKKLSE